STTRSPTSPRRSVDGSAFRAGRRASYTRLLGPAGPASANDGSPDPPTAPALPGDHRDAVPLSAGPGRAQGGDRPVGPGGDGELRDPVARRFPPLPFDRLPPGLPGLQRVRRGARRGRQLRARPVAAPDRAAQRGPR